MKITIRKPRFQFVIFLLAAFVYGLGEREQFKIIIYAAYAVIMFLDLRILILQREGQAADEALVEMVLYSVALPDNFVVIGVVLCACILRGRLCVNKLFIPITAYIALRICMGIFSYPYSIMFSILYWSAFVVYLFLGERIFSHCSISRIENLLFEISLIQSVVIVERAFVDNGFSHIDQDWVTGTFGTYEGVQLFAVEVLIGTYNLLRYVKTREKRKLFSCVLAYTNGLLTGSIALTMLLLVGITVYAVFVSKGIKTKIVFVLGMAGTVLLIVLSNRAWVIRDILNLRSWDYMSNSIRKIMLYINTFWTIPKSDWNFALFGAGIGRYTSRAAITLTGNYLDYVKVSDQSVYTQMYVTPMIEYAETMEAGTRAYPYSELCTLVGELGWIGFALVAVLIIHIFKEANRDQKLIMIIMGLFLLYDNYFEFAKIAFMTLFIFRILDQKGKCFREEEKEGVSLHGKSKCDCTSL